MTRLEITAKNEDGSLHYLVMEDADAVVINGEGEPDTLQAKGHVVAYEVYQQVNNQEQNNEQTDGAAP